MTAELSPLFTQFAERAQPDVDPGNAENPYDWIGVHHNELLDQIAVSIPAIVVRGRTSIDRTRTEQAIESVAAGADVRFAKPPLEAGIADIRPPRTSLFDIADDPLAFLARMFNERLLTENVFTIIRGYLSAARWIGAEVSAFVEMSKQAERFVAAAKLADDERKRILIGLAVGRHSAVYWSREQRRATSPWSVFCPCGQGQTDPAPSGAMRDINWWKVLACDCVGGICSGGNPVAAAGTSACSVIGQL